MKFDEAKLIERAVEEGLRYGIRRWNKYDKQPELPEGDAKAEEIVQHFSGFVMDSLYEICSFQGGASDE